MFKGQDKEKRTEAANLIAATASSLTLMGLYDSAYSIVVERKLFTSRV